jgi:anaerobic selenocysteine-containing dehydrogenase
LGLERLDEPSGTSHPRIDPGIKKDPDKKLIVIDPRRSETAERADIHLPIRPGTDSMLLKAMIRIILDNSWEDQAFIAAHVNGWEKVKPLFDGFDARRAVTEVCGLDYETVLEVTRLLAQTRSCIHQDLGIYMNRNSSINNYMLHILRAITGRFCVEGGQIIPAFLFPWAATVMSVIPKSGAQSKPICFRSWDLFRRRYFRRKCSMIIQQNSGSDRQCQ